MEWLIPHSWYDVWRDFNLVFGLSCVYMLLRRFRLSRGDWNEKTRDLWFGLFMWSIASVVLSVDGVHRNLGLSYSLPFITAAILTTHKGLYKRGTWGGKR